MNEPVPQDTPISAVVAKMVCNEMRSSRFNQSYVQNRVELGAVCGDRGEDKTFSDATPGGACWLNISAGRPALNFFRPSRKYYVTFTEAPD